MFFADALRARQWFFHVSVSPVCGGLFWSVNSCVSVHVKIEACERGRPTDMNAPDCQLRSYHVVSPVFGGLFQSVIIGRLTRWKKLQKHE